MKRATTLARISQTDILSSASVSLVIMHATHSLPPKWGKARTRSTMMPEPYNTPQQTGGYHQLAKPPASPFATPPSLRKQEKGGGGGGKEQSWSLTTAAVALPETGSPTSTSVLTLSLSLWRGNAITPTLTVGYREHYCIHFPFARANTRNKYSWELSTIYR